MIKKLLIPFFCFFASVVIQAQAPLSIHLSEDDGVPEKVVYRILEDKNGLIWLATNSGLFSFDGEKYKSYRHPKQVRPSVFGLYLDQHERVWYTNMGGEFYYVENGKVVLFLNLKERIGARLIDYKIIENNLVFTDNKDLYEIDINTKKINKSKLFNKETAAFIKDENNYYYYQNNEFNEINGDSHIRHFKSKITENEEHPLYIFNYGEKLYLQFITGNIYTFYEVNETGIKRVNTFDTITHTSISHLKKIGESLWFFTVNGAYEYHYINHEIVLKNHYLKGKRITDLIINRNKNYIFSTLNDGLYILPDVTVKEYGNLTFKQSLISHFTAINDSVFNYISNNNKLHSANFNSGKDISRDIDYFKEQFVYYDNIKNKGLFFNGGFLEFYNPLTLKVSKKSFEHSPKDIKRLNDSLYMTTSHIKTRILDNNFEDKVIYKGRAGAFITTKSGHYYVNTQEGLKWGTVKENNFENILSNGKKIYMRHFVNKTNGDSVWISRPNWGIYLFEKGVILKTIFKSEKGLLDKNIRAMDSDDKSLWLATNKGIQQYDYKTEAFTNFSVGDEISRPRILKLQVTDKYVWYQTSRGVYRFPKTKKRKSEYIPDIYFSEIKIGNQEQDIKDNYVIDYNANALAIKFMINGFNTLQEYQFEYKIDGLNPKWVTLELGKHQLDFNSLPSRKYIVNVRAKSILKGTYTNTIQFKANVTLPFWKRWWFSTLIALIGVISVIVFFKIKARHKEKQKQKELEQIEIKHQLVALKLENLRSQMNPHFIFNALNSIQEYIMLNQKKLASDYLGKFADLMRTYLHHSSKGKITLQEEIDCLDMYLELEKLRFEDKLTYNIDNKFLQSNDICIPTMLIQPYVENALKHGLLHRKDNRNLKISFQINEDSKTIKCRVTDNGVGRIKAEEYKARSHKQHSSFASKANQDRLNLLNYGKERQIGVTITDLINEEIAIGTQVDIVIPYENI